MLRIKGHTFIRIKGHTCCGLMVTLLFGSRDSFTIRVRQRIPLLFGSDKRFCTIPLAQDSFTITLSRDSFTIRVRQGILYYPSQRIPLLFGSDKEFLYYSGPTKDSCTIRVRQKGPSPRRARAKSRQLLFIGTRWHNKH